MIGRLRGYILEKLAPDIVLDVQGVGYEVTMPLTCCADLPECGQEIEIFTHFVVREDAQLLYGFLTREDRALFRMLIRVNGVGPKLALTILSDLSTAQFMHAVERSDIHILTKLSGVGTKTAERLIIEMKDKLNILPFSDIKMSLTSKNESRVFSNFSANELENEAVCALVALGYKHQEASRRINKVRGSGMNSQALIKAALNVIL